MIIMSNLNIEEISSFVIKVSVDFDRSENLIILNK
jgi:hypothetical protein